MRATGYVVRAGEPERASPLMGKERAPIARKAMRGRTAEYLFSPSRLEIKRRQVRRTNCLGRMTESPRPTVKGRASSGGGPEVKSGNRCGLGPLTC